MRTLGDYKEGLLLFQNQEYKNAVSCFVNGLNFGNSSECALMLGKCCELGLGVAKDLVMAKDNYKSALQQFSLMHSHDSEEIVWLKAKLAELTDVPDVCERTCYIDSVGCVKVSKSERRGWSIGFSEEGTHVKVNLYTPFYRGFYIAEVHASKENKTWTCDGHTRFYDGYTIEAELFRLTVKRGQTQRYETSINGRDCTVIFPYDADLNYLYVQETIMKKARELLKKRADVIFRQKLQEVSARTGIPYGKCKVDTRMSKVWATHSSPHNDIVFSLSCIQLPEESLEAICLHELIHNFVSGHDNRFYAKMLEYGGRNLYDRDMDLEKGISWKCLRLK